MHEKYDLCLEVLRRLEKASVLKEMVIIGSWSLYFYHKHLFPDYDITQLRTRDLDLLVPSPNAIKEKVDVPMLLKDLGFVVELTDFAGHFRFLE